MSNKPQDFKKKQATSAKSWKKKQVAQTELELPSGNTALVKPMRITAMLSDGFFPDALRAIVLQQISDEARDEEATTKAIEESFADFSKLSEMMEVFDKVVLSVVMQPVVLPAPEEGASRDDEVLYVDEIDMDDKMFIFQWAVGGDRDIERFREESKSDLGSLENL